MMMMMMMMIEANGQISHALDDGLFSRPIKLHFSVYKIIRGTAFM